MLNTQIYFRINVSFKNSFGANKCRNFGTIKRTVKSARTFIAFFLILFKLERTGHIFEEYSNIKFHENPSSWSRGVPCGQTGMTKITITFRNFTKAPRKQGFSEPGNELRGP